MEIFKQLKKLGYKHYIDLTIEELDALSINDIEKRIEYSLVVDWFREKYEVHIQITHSSNIHGEIGYKYHTRSANKMFSDEINFNSKLGLIFTYEEAREQAILKAIELCQNKK